MGRIKSTMVKNIATKVYEENSDKFSGDFSKNKEVVDQVLKMASKRLRNIVVGYITTLKNREQLSE